MWKFIDKHPYLTAFVIVPTLIAPFWAFAIGKSGALKPPTA